MHPTRWRAAAALLATASLAAACVAPPPQQPIFAAAAAPQPGPQANTATQPATAAELDQLVAPVALYDDQLLADVLTAATYPAEVVQAHRWALIPANTSLTGAPLIAALATQGWDPSVQSLAPFPAILASMDSHLEWTQRLGEAFLAQPGDVMAAVQRLRARAQAAGTLQTSPQEVVSQEGGNVTIAPPPNQMIYVPSYNPWCAYGAWPYSVGGPYFYTPYTGSCLPNDLQLDWSLGLYQPFDYWGWGYFDWRRGELRVRGDRWGRFGGWQHGWHGGFDHGFYGNHGSGAWQHDSGHRGFVPYNVPGNMARFGGEGAHGFRGYPGRNGEPANIGHGTAPAFESLGTGHGAWADSARGQASRGVSGFGFHGGGGFGGGSHAGGGGGGGAHGGGGGGHR